MILLVLQWDIHVLDWHLVSFPFSPFTFATPRKHTTPSPCDCRPMTQLSPTSWFKLTNKVALSLLSLVHSSLFLPSPLPPSSFPNLLASEGRMYHPSFLLFKTCVSTHTYGLCWTSHKWLHQNFNFLTLQISWRSKAQIFPSFPFTTYWLTSALIRGEITGVAPSCKQPVNSLEQ